MREWPPLPAVRDPLDLAGRSSRRIMANPASALCAGSRDRLAASAGRLPRARGTLAGRKAARNDPSGRK